MMRPPPRTLLAAWVCGCLSLMALALLLIAGLVAYYLVEDTWRKCEARGGYWNSEIPRCSDGKGLPNIF